MDISSILIEYEHTNDIYTTSGICLGNQYVLAPSNIFVKVLNSTTKIQNIINNSESGVIHQIKIDEKDEKLRVYTKAKNSQPANIVALFKCKNITFSTPKILYDWRLDTNEIDKQLKEALSLFIILKIVGSDRSMFDLTDLMGCLFELLSECPRGGVLRGDKICTESTPFGNRSFINSFSAGVVSNVVGENNCFVLIDAPTVPGSEGGLVFKVETSTKPQIARKFPVGIILASLTWWKGEFVGLSLVANLYPLIVQLCQTSTKANISETPLNVHTSCESFENVLATTDFSLVQVYCGGSWGTGIIVDVNKGVIITNSHVVINDNLCEIKLHIKDQTVPCRLIYRTPDALVFDLAVLKCCPKRLKQFGMKSAKMTNDLPNLGEEIIAAGFPFFTQKIINVPTISYGHISYTNPSILKTTASIHPGASGGAICKLDGEIVGVIVCNTRLINEVNIVYPNINMAIPWLAVKNVINDFIANEDEKVLRLLHKKEHHVVDEWTLKTSKL